MASERSPALDEVIQAAISARLLGTHVALPARIVRYDAAKQQADCQPVVQQAHDDEEGARVVAALPVVPGVPVLFPGGGGYRLTFPIKAGDDGDFCLLVFSEVSLDKWLTGKGAIVDPEIDHAHALADAVAFVGLRPFGAPWKSAPTDEATLGKDDGVQIHFEGSLITAGDKAGAQFVALANKVLDELTAIQTALATHTHTYNPGPGAAAQTAAVTQSYSPSSVAASQFKAK